MPSLTCRETLQFYSGLMLPHVGHQERALRIQDVFEQLDILEHQDTLVFQ